MCANAKVQNSTMEADGARNLHLIHRFFWLPLFPHDSIDFSCNLLQGSKGCFCVKRLILILPKNGGEEIRDDAPQHQICVCDGWIPTLPVANVN